VENCSRPAALPPDRLSTLRPCGAPGGELRSVPGHDRGPRRRRWPLRGRWPAPATKTRAWPPGCALEAPERPGWRVAASRRRGVP